MMHKQLLALLVIAQFSNPAAAGGKEYDTDRYTPPAEQANAKNKSNGSEAKPSPGTSDSALKSSPKMEEVLAQVLNGATENLKLAETYYQNKSYKMALGTSKESLDYVRQQTGVHPKANYVNKFNITTAFFDSVRVSTTDFDKLPLRARDQLSLSLQAEQNGYFLDLLNLAKRTNLIYIKAFVATLKQQGPLLGRDISKVKQDILDVYAIPLFVRNNDIERLYAVFDFEVANSDQNYLFNRELYTFMLENPEFFGATTEAAVDEVLKQHISVAREKLKKDIAGYEPIGYPALSEEKMNALADVKKCQSGMEKEYENEFSNGTREQQETESQELFKKYTEMELDKNLAGKNPAYKTLYKFEYYFQKGFYGGYRDTTDYVRRENERQVRDATKKSCIVLNYKIRFSHPNFELCQNLITPILNEKYARYPLWVKLLSNEHCAEIVSGLKAESLPTDAKQFEVKYKDQLALSSKILLDRKLYSYIKENFSNHRYFLDYSEVATPIFNEIEKINQKIEKIYYKDKTASQAEDLKRAYAELEKAKSSIPYFISEESRYTRTVSLSEVEFSQLLP